MKLVRSTTVTVSDLMLYLSDAHLLPTSRGNVWGENRESSYILYIQRNFGVVSTPFVVGWFMDKKILVDGYNRYLALKRNYDLVKDSLVLLSEVTFDHVWEITDMYKAMNLFKQSLMNRCDVFLIHFSNKIGEVIRVRDEILKTIKHEKVKKVASCIALALIYSELTGRKVGWRDVFNSTVPVVLTIASNNYERVKTAADNAISRVREEKIKVYFATYGEYLGLKKFMPTGRPEITVFTKAMILDDVGLDRLIKLLLASFRLGRRGWWRLRDLERVLLRLIDTLGLKYDTLSILNIAEMIVEDYVAKGICEKSNIVPVYKRRDKYYRCDMDAIRAEFTVDLDKRFLSELKPL